MVKLLARIIAFLVVGLGLLLSLNTIMLGLTDPLPSEGTREVGLGVAIGIACVFYLVAKMSQAIKWLWLTLFRST